MSIVIYTDGGCLGNPGPGGWAYVLIADEKVIKRNGNAPATTNNRMELTAVIEAFKALDNLAVGDRPVILHTDSQYVQKGISQWIHSWIKKGWRTSTNKPVKNMELWKELKTLTDRFQVDWRWVKGHAGDTFNEMCDTMVGEAMREIADG